MNTDPSPSRKEKGQEGKPFQKTCASAEETTPYSLQRKKKKNRKLKSKSVRSKVIFSVRRRFLAKEGGFEGTEVSKRGTCH